MVEIQNRLEIKQNLLSEITKLKKKLNCFVDSPITDLEIDADKIKLIETLTINLEELNPFPDPLLSDINLLNGAWLLQYSTAREIRSLKGLPFGFLVEKIHQVIDVNNNSFENQAWVKHLSGFISGYVRVTATFEPALQANQEPSNQKINIDFKQRFLGIDRILGLKTKLFDPFKVVAAKNPQGRIPSLNITYIDRTMRIGRGGDGSLFILTKV